MENRLNTLDKRIALEILQAKTANYNIRQLRCLKSMGITMQFDPKTKKYHAFKTYKDNQYPNFYLATRTVCTLPGRNCMQSKGNFQRSQLIKKLIARINS